MTPSVLLRPFTQRLIIYSLSLTTRNGASRPGISLFSHARADSCGGSASGMPSRARARASRAAVQVFSRFFRFLSSFQLAWHIWPAVRPIGCRKAAGSASGVPSRARARARVAATFFHVLFVPVFVMWIIQTAGSALCGLVLRQGDCVAPILAISTRPQDTGRPPRAISCRVQRPGRAGVSASGPAWP